MTRVGLCSRALLCLLFGTVLLCLYKRQNSSFYSQNQTFCPTKHLRRNTTRENLTDNNAAYSNNNEITKECREKTHIVYVKIGKTGSGTLSSIFINFGRSRNLTFALPRTGGHFGYNALQVGDISPIARGKRYEILAHHSTYNTNTINAVFPKDTKTIASVREPFSHFISAFFFYQGMDREFPPHIKASKNATLQISWLINHRYRLKGEGNFYFNRISRRLGVPFSKTLDINFVKSYIASSLDNNIDLMVIREYFDESLILLKRLFCWELSDIIYLSYHVNKYPEFGQVYNDGILRKHRELAAAEYLIYDHFYRKFWRTVWREGPEFFEEVRTFKELLSSVQNFCASNPFPQGSIRLSSSKWNKAFTVTREKCADLRLNIRDFAYSERAKQLKYVHQKGSLMQV